MCFSASASFIAAGGLSVIGVVSLKRARKRERILAVIPLLFAFQQALEGVQWLVARPGLCSDVASYGFLFVALLVWPIFVPFVIYRLDARRRKLLRWFIVVGIATSSYFVWYLLTQSVLVEQIRHSLSYGLWGPYWTGVVIGYGISTIGSLLVSSIRFFQVLGLVLLASAIAAWVFFSAAFASVWCFFAAALSGVLYLYIARKK